MLKSRIASMACTIALAGAVTTPSIAYARGDGHTIESPSSQVKAADSRFTDRRTVEISVTVLDTSESPIGDAVVVTAEGGKGVTGPDGVARFTVDLNAGLIETQVTGLATIAGVNHTGTNVVSIDSRSPRFDAGTIHLAATSNCGDVGWMPTFGSHSNTNDYIWAFAIFDDGSGDGPALFAGGDFTTAGEAWANRIAKWDGTRWHEVGGGMDDRIRALAVFDDGSGTGPMLYAGGDFTSAGGTDASSIARWNGTEWSAVGEGINGSVYALCASNDGGPDGQSALYAGGVFTDAGNITVSNVAMWDGSSWSALDAGLNDLVHALIVHNDKSGGRAGLYAGGDFTSAGEVSTSRVAMWNGEAWEPLDNGLNKVVRTFAVFDDGSADGPALYAGGDFHGGAVDVSRIAKWDGASWSNLGGGITSPHNAAVFSLAAWDDGSGNGSSLYVGGHFDEVEGQDIDRIAKWDGASWSAVGEGLEDTVFALAAIEGRKGGDPLLFAGGTFASVGGSTVDARYFAQWDGDSWSTIGDGVSGFVRFLAVFDDGLGGGPCLYVGGSFTSAGGVSAKGIAKWDGDSWSALGSGLSGVVRAMTVFDDGSGGGPALYVGGNFGVLGDVDADDFAKWDGTAWAALGPGLPSSSIVRALAVYNDVFSGGGTALYVGGTFEGAGYVEAHNIARWDGNIWTSVGDGLSATVSSLAVYEGTTLSGSGAALYAGGLFEFDWAGNVELNGIARWDGSKWSPVGGGVDGNVWTIVVDKTSSVDGPVIFVGGFFTMAGETPANNIAKWDGTSWSALGSGLENSGEGIQGVLDIEILHRREGEQPYIYAGGYFDVAGEVEVNFVAGWDGEDWSALGSGVSFVVHDLIVLHEEDVGGPALIAGGTFTASPGGDSYIAKWVGCDDTPPCDLADLDCDGLVDGADLAILLGAWGACDKCDDCLADLDGSCAVDGADLAILLGNWTY